MLDLELGEKTAADQIRELLFADDAALVAGSPPMFPLS